MLTTIIYITLKKKFRQKISKDKDGRNPERVHWISFQSPFSPYRHAVAGTLWENYSGQPREARSCLSLPLAAVTMVWASYFSHPSVLILKQEVTCQEPTGSDLTSRRSKGDVNRAPAKLILYHRKGAPSPSRRGWLRMLDATLPHRRTHSHK